MVSSGNFIDPVSGQNLPRAGSVTLTTPAATALNAYNLNAPDGTPVLGFPFLMMTGQASAGGGAYNGVRFHILNGRTQGPSSSLNLVPMPANFNVGPPWGGALGFEARFVADYQNFPIHYEANIVNWKTPAMVAAAAGSPLAQNIVHFPHTINANYWKWQAGAWVACANPIVNVTVATNPQAGAGNTVDLSQHTAHTIQNILGLSPLLSQAIARAKAPLQALAAGTVTSPEEAFDEISDAIRSTTPGAVGGADAIDALSREWPRLQSLLKTANNVYPHARINAQHTNSLTGPNYRPANEG